MKKALLLFAIGITMVGCVDENKRMENLKKLFPYYKVEPATGLIKERGYQFIIIDTAQQIIAVEFGLFSETRIASFRNVR